MWTYGNKKNARNHLSLFGDKFSPVFVELEKHERVLLVENNRVRLLTINYRNNSYNYTLSVYTDPFVFSSGFVVTTCVLLYGISPLLLSPSYSRNPFLCWYPVGTAFVYCFLLFCIVIIAADAFLDLIGCLNLFFALVLWRVVWVCDVWLRTTSFFSLVTYWVVRK
jgi:hypothetical protein